MSEPIIRLREVFPNMADDWTVTLKDARLLLSDQMFSGGMFLKSSGVESPTHVRVAPSALKGAA